MPLFSSQKLEVSPSRLWRAEAGSQNLEYKIKFLYLATIPLINSLQILNNKSLSACGGTNQKLVGKLIPGSGIWHPATSI